MIRCVFVCLLFVNFVAEAAHEPRWYSGSCVLANKTVVTGRFSVNALYDLVLMQRSGGGAEVLPAHRVSSVFFYDSAANINRRYISIPSGEARSKWSLYELVVSGVYKVVRKPLQGLRFSDPNDHIGFSYYFVRLGVPEPISSFAVKLYPHLKENSKLVSFVRDEKLDASQLDDAIRIITYYNSLSREEMYVSLQ